MKFITYKDGYCYVPTMECYSEKEKCGVLGIVCHETSEPYTKCFTSSKVIFVGDKL